jgi:hypothetical protein
MNNSAPPSFSRSRKWIISLNLFLMISAVAALLVMTNYLAARHHARWSWSAQAQAELSPLSQRVLAGVTNPVKITLYMRKEEPLYELCWNLLKVYRLTNERIQLDAVDYDTEPGAAELIKSRCKLGRTDRDMVIFECQGRPPKYVYQGELSDLDMQALLSGQGEIRRTHFKGELLFTSAIMTVINPRSSKAYFLEGHGEHDPESEEGQMGYSKFAGVLRENNVVFEKLNLAGPTEVPPDCNLLIVAGARAALQKEVLEKIDRYLKNGGRMLVLFYPYAALPRSIGLEATLADWGVAVGRHVVQDEKNAVLPNKSDMVVSSFSSHPVVKKLYGYQLYMVLPRLIDKSPTAADGASAPQVDPLVYTGPQGRIITDIRPGGVIVPAEGDLRGNVPLMVAVEKGGVRNVTAERGTTRMIVAGDSLFLNNANLETEGNHPFASYAVNWLLARDELLVNVPAQRIVDYKLTMTAAQMSGARWLLLGAMPGAVLILGALVWLRRRR